MGNLLNPLWRKKGDGSATTATAAPAASEAVTSSAAPQSAAASPRSDATGEMPTERKSTDPMASAVAANAPSASHAPDDEEPPREVSSLELPEPIRRALAAAIASDAHALLLDPEEFECQLCTIGPGGIEVIGECPLDDYHLAHRALQLLDRDRLVSGEKMCRVQLFTAVTDLGRRNVLQLFDPTLDPEIVTERRKGNVRTINRLRSGTSLTRHNRKRLLATLERAGEREGPPFRERLLNAGLIADDAPDDLTSLIQTCVMPRKAVSRVLGEYLGIPFVDVEESVPRTHGPLLERDQIVEWEAIPVGEEDDAVIVAMADPTDEATLERIKAHLGRPVVVRVAAATDIRVATEKIFRTR